MKKSYLATLIIAAFFAPEYGLAQSTSRIDKRQDNQDKRIEKGVATGQLNQKESARLEKGQAHVQNLEDKALADGKVTKKEKVHIEHAQDKQSRRIARQKHDKQKAKAQ